jgi:predicted nucleic acid-binding protein
VAGGLTYDTGALIAAERNERRIWALHRRSLERGIVPTVPAGVLAQGWRGGPQHQLSRLLAGCRVEPLDESRARSAGAVCGAAGSSDVVDAAVIVGAAARGDIVVTSDPDDLRRLRDALRVSVRIETI